MPGPSFWPSSRLRSPYPYSFSFLLLLFVTCPSFLHSHSHLSFRVYCRSLDVTTYCLSAERLTVCLVFERFLNKPKLILLIWTTFAQCLNHIVYTCITYTIQHVQSCACIPFKVIMPIQSGLDFMKKGVHKPCADTKFTYYSRGSFTFRCE